MTDDNDVYTPAQYREHQDGYGVRDAHEHRHTGIVRDELVSRFLSIQAENYDPLEADEPGRMPGEADTLEESREILAIGGTETARSALENGDMPTLKHLTGDQQERADISGLKAIQQVDEIIEDPAPVIVIIGDMGTGKTDLACLLAQRAKHLLGIEKVASNVPTLRETNQWVDEDGETRDGFVPNWRSMEQWVQQDGDPLEDDQRGKLFIGDEFSSGGDGTGKSGYLMRKKMGPLVFKIRKYDGMLIYVAHDESSIHPLLWRVGYVIKKESKKRATVADKIKSGEVRDVQFEIDGIPATDWRYNTKDPAVWSWTGAEDDDDPEPGEIAYDVAVWTVKACKEDGLSHRETAKFVPFGKSWVGDRWPEIQDGEHRSALDRVEAVTT
ncbi:hypothetical protein EA462_15410 [Natrarchaeobius halalkaliphilus]|uniref:Uncharacterized protein n=1 Tax=Natrarchaeobius halalkaliphilus TaxID=1679091 RepID=A0A3N6LKN8_9EURY|nr:hypothetical protein [Natrarchaeobius halalkaliphilus]RQG87028.1 hypothetical protein EA462_15410 [Natrarchaeobius halalkaliphilus]